MRGEYSPRIAFAGGCFAFSVVVWVRQLIEAATFLVATVWATIEACPEPHSRPALWAFGVGVVRGRAAWPYFGRFSFLWHVASAA